MKVDQKLLEIVVEALESIKAINIRVLDVMDKTTMTDVLVIASGNSTRQVKSLAHEVQEKARQAGYHVIGVEGEQTGEWALVDLGDIVVHVMQPSVRDFYNLEKLWGEDSPGDSQQDAG